jgi:CcmD family protein
MKNILMIMLCCALHLPQVLAQGNRDFMRETGKINVVIAVIVVIFLGIAVYLMRLDRRLTNLEHQVKDDHERKN